MGRSLVVGSFAVFIVASEGVASDGGPEGARPLSPAAAAVVDRLSAAARLSWRDRSKSASQSIHGRSLLPLGRS